MVARGVGRKLADFMCPGVNANLAVRIGFEGLDEIRDIAVSHAGDRNFCLIDDFLPVLLKDAVCEKLMLKAFFS